MPIIEGHQVDDIQRLVWFQVRPQNDAALAACERVLGEPKVVQRNGKGAVMAVPDKSAAMLRASLNGHVLKHWRVNPIAEAGRAVAQVAVEQSSTVVVASEVSACKSTHRAER